MSCAAILLSKPPNDALCINPAPPVEYPLTLPRTMLIYDLPRRRRSPTPGPGVTVHSLTSTNMLMEPESPERALWHLLLSILPHQSSLLHAPHCSHKNNRILQVAHPLHDYLLRSSNAQILHHQRIHLRRPQAAFPRYMYAFCST